MAHNNTLRFLCNSFINAKHALRQRCAAALFFLLCHLRKFLSYSTISVRMSSSRSSQYNSFGSSGYLYAIICPYVFLLCVLCLDRVFWIHAKMNLPCPWPTPPLIPPDVNQNQGKRLHLVYKLVSIHQM